MSENFVDLFCSACSAWKKKKISKDTKTVKIKKKGKLRLSQIYFCAILPTDTTDSPHHVVCIVHNIFINTLP